MKHLISRRQEANAITCFAFRNGMLENLHAGEDSELLTDPKWSRITDEEMKELMIEASSKVAELLRLKEREPEKYWETIASVHLGFTKRWDTKTTFKLRRRSHKQWRKDIGL